MSVFLITSPSRPFSFLPHTNPVVYATVEPRSVLYSQVRLLSSFLSQKNKKAQNILAGIVHYTIVLSICSVLYYPLPQSLYSLRFKAELVPNLNLKDNIGPMDEAGSPRINKKLTYFFFASFSPLQHNI